MSSYVDQQTARFHRALDDVLREERLRITRLIGSLELEPCSCEPSDLYLTSTHRPECMFEAEANFRAKLIAAIVPLPAPSGFVTTYEGEPDAVRAFASDFPSVAAAGFMGSEAKG